MRVQLGEKFDIYRYIIYPEILGAMKANTGEEN